MGILQDKFDQILREKYSPQEMSATVLKRIAARQGLTVSEVQLQALRDAISNKGVTDAEISIGEKDSKVAVSDDDLMKELERCSEESTESMQDTVQNILAEIWPPFLVSLYKSAPAALDDRRKQERAFESRLYDRWKDGLDRLEMLLMIAYEAGERFHRDLKKGVNIEASERPDQVRYLWDVLFQLHARACRITSEILCLLKGGFADGANARWRSLHEIAIISMFLVEHRGELPKRYSAHAAIERFRAAEQYQEHHEALRYPPLSEMELAQVKQAYDDAIKEFGHGFSAEYGWAASAFDKPKANPRFTDIEQSLNMDKWRPFYKMACHSVHAGAHGMHFCLGLPDDAEAKSLAGASNTGLCDPGHSCAISLTLISVALLCSTPNIDALVASKMMLKLCSDIGDAFLEAHQTFDNKKANELSVPQPSA